MTPEAKAYAKHKNLKLAAQELGMVWQTLYVRLKKQGIPVTGDKSRYGSDKDRLAAFGEQEFIKLVPFAEDQNSKKFQSKFDYLACNQKIDIKTSSLKQGNPRFASRRWAFSVKKQEFCADFVVCFAITDEDKNYRVFLIPGELVRNYQTVSISENGKSKWLDYEVKPNELSDFFKEYLS